MISEIDLKVLWKELDRYETELNGESKVLEDVWIKISDLKKKNDEDIALLTNRPEFHFQDPETLITFNIGGQLFETSVEVMTQDPYSLLAACCRVEPIISPDINGHIFIDRDWWLFRHILGFLRSKVLPSELETLKELYIEASYYRLETLQKAISEVPLDQVSNVGPYISNTWPKEGTGVDNNVSDPYQQTIRSFLTK